MSQDAFALFDLLQTGVLVPGLLGHLMHAAHDRFPTPAEVEEAHRLFSQRGPTAPFTAASLHDLLLRWVLHHLTVKRGFRLTHHFPSTRLPLTTALPPLVVSTHLREEAPHKYTVALSLAEAESLRRILHVRRSELRANYPGLELRLRLLGADYAVIDALAPEQDAPDKAKDTNYQALVAQCALRLFDGELEHSPRSVNVLLRALQVRSSGVTRTTRGPDTRLSDVSGGLPSCDDNATVVRLVYPRDRPARAAPVSYGSIGSWAADAANVDAGRRRPSKHSSRCAMRFTCFGRCDLLLACLGGQTPALPFQPFVKELFLYRLGPTCLDTDWLSRYCTSLGHRRVGVCVCAWPSYSAA